MEDWVTIQTLKKRNNSLSNREIGRLLGLSHNTVKRAIEKESPPEYERSKKISNSLLPFEEVIFKMLNVNKFKGSRYWKRFFQKAIVEARVRFIIITKE